MYRAVLPHCFAGLSAINVPSMDKRVSDLDYRHRGASIPAGRKAVVLARALGEKPAPAMTC